MTVTYKNNDKFHSRKETGASIASLIRDEGVDLGSNGVQLNVKEPSQFGNWFSLLINFLPLLVFGVILLWMMRQAQGSNSQAMSFGKSRARMFTGNKPTVTFVDVAGVDEAKEELAGSRRISEVSREVCCAGSAHPTRRSAGRPSRHR